MKSAKMLTVSLMLLLAFAVLSGCDNDTAGVRAVKNAEAYARTIARLKESEFCYEGVVYIQGVYSMAPKFNKDSTVATCDG